MSTETQVIALAKAVAADVKQLYARGGDFSKLNTTAKTNLVAAINEIYGLIGQSGAKIDDTATDGNTSVTWSADKIYDSILASANQVRTSILGGAGEAFDTLIELANALGNDANFSATVTAALANRVRFDAPQTLTTAQQLQACTNIGVGNPEADFTAAYNTAKA
jgi:hypothetical protein